MSSWVYYLRCCAVRYDFRLKAMSDSFYLHRFVRVHVLLMLFVFIYACWDPTRFSFHMFASFNSSTTGGRAEQELLTLPEHEFTPWFLRCTCRLHNYTTRVVYLRYLCLFAHSGVEHILCCVFLFVFLRLVFPVSHFFLLPLPSSQTFIYKTNIGLK
jgi:hypothetical protein